MQRIIFVLALMLFGNLALAQTPNTEQQNRRIAELRQNAEQEAQNRSGYGYIILGNELWSFRRYNEARTAWHKAAEIEENFRFMYLTSGAKLSTIGRNRLAIEDYKLWIRATRNADDRELTEPIRNVIQLLPIGLSPKGRAVYNFGLAFLELGEREIARDVYNELRTIDSSLAARLLTGINSNR